MARALSGKNILPSPSGATPGWAELASESIVVSNRKSGFFQGTRFSNKERTSPVEHYSESWNSLRREIGRLPFGIGTL